MRWTTIHWAITRARAVERRRAFDERFLHVGLLEVIGAGRAAKPAPVAAADDPGVVSAPVSGRVVSLDRVGDPVFAQGMLGAGVGIRPREAADGPAVAFSPVSGTIMADVKTRHALLIRTDAGAEVLLHVGVDSVRLHGKGFRLFVGKGDQVRAGDPLISFDRALLERSGLDDTVIVTVTNSESFSRVESAADDALVSAGSAVLRTDR